MFASFFVGEGVATPSESVVTNLRYHHGNCQARSARLLALGPLQRFSICLFGPARTARARRPMTVVPL